MKKSKRPLAASAPVQKPKLQCPIPDGLKDTVTLLNTSLFKGECKASEVVALGKVYSRWGYFLQTQADLLVLASCVNADGDFGFFGGAGVELFGFLPN